MTVLQFEKFADIPGIEGYLDKMPIFATQGYTDYLKETKNYSINWFYGIVSSDIRLMIPFAVRKKNFFKQGEFLTTIIHFDENNDIDIERDFLNSIISIIKQKKLCDWIKQPANWVLFNVVPANSISCEFGTYRINLQRNDENELYSKIARQHRREITKAINKNILIKSGPELLEDCFKVFLTSNSTGNNLFPTKNELEILLKYLQNNLHIYVAYNNSIPKNSVIYCSDRLSFYGLYSSRMNSTSDDGANHLLHWQAIKDAKLNGIKYYDFVGARINPNPGTKHEGIQRFKRHFGAELVKGFLWKMPISNFKYRIYNYLLRTLSTIKREKFKGDIIDQERNR